MEHLDRITLWQYITDASGLADTDQLRNHLSHCDVCRKEYELLKQIEEGLHALDEEVPSLGFSNSVVRKIEADASLERRSRFSTNIFRYTVMGAFAVAILSALVFGFGLDLELAKTEEAIKGPLILIFSASVILSVFYIVDRICNKVFRQTPHSESL